MKRKFVIVTGYARGIEHPCPIDYVQPQVYEQIPTAKRDIIKWFANLGISENEISFEIIEK